MMDAFEVSLPVFLRAAAILMAVSLIGSGPVLAQGPPSGAGCPFNEALDYHIILALKQHGVTDEQFEALIAAGEIGQTTSGAA